MASPGTASLIRAFPRSPSPSPEPLEWTPLKRAAEDHAIGLVRRLVDRHPHPKPRMPMIKQFSENGPVGVLKSSCTTRLARICLCTRTPVPREVRAIGRVLSVPILGGIHHQYVRI
jgi:hypothetical protein